MSVAFKITSKGIRCQPRRSWQRGPQITEPRAGGHGQPTGITELPAPKPAEVNGKSQPESLLDDSSIPGVEIPSEFELLCQEVEAAFGVAPYSVLAGAFVVAGTAIGRHSFLDTGFFPTPINASLAFAFCDDDVGRSEEVARIISAPLAEDQERKLAALSDRTQAVEDEIQEIIRQRESFFGGALIRDPKLEATFTEKIADLRNLQRWTMIVENGSAGTLSQNVANSDGLVALYGDRALGRLLDAPTKGARDFHVLARAGQGRTPDSAVLKLAGHKLPLRPAVGCLLACSQKTAPRFICSSEPAAREFCEQVIFCALTDPKAASPSSGSGHVRRLTEWFARVGGLVAARDAGSPRRLTLSRRAEALLCEYAREVAQVGPDQRNWLRHATVQATKIGLILHVWNNEVSNEISERTMHNAIELTRWLLKKSIATVQRVIAGDQDKARLVRAAEMWSKIVTFGKPVSERDLYRTYLDTRTALHTPDLQFLLRNGHARRLADGRVEPQHDQPPDFAVACSGRRETAPAAGTRAE